MFKFETMKHRLGFGLYGGIKAIKNKLYGEDRTRNYFIFINILNCRTNLRKIIEMTWLLMLRNLSVAILNTTLQLLDL